MKIGVVTRVLSADPSGVKEAAAKTRVLIDTCIEMGLASTFCVIVPEDKEYLDHDCGETAEELAVDLTALKARHPNVTISLRILKKGDVFCDAPNAGTDELLRQGCTHAAFVSYEAVAYIDQPTVDAIKRAVEYPDVLVTGLAVHELKDVVRKGAVSNACAVWQIEALHLVGGFSADSRQMRIGATDHPMVQFALPNGEIKRTPAHGCDGAGAAARLVRENGACIAVLDPCNSEAVYKDSPVQERREIDEYKTASTEARSDHMVRKAGVNGLDDLSNYVVYRG